MLSAVIHSALGYPASTMGTITGTPEVRPSRSSRTRERSSQCSNACTGYGPNCLTTFWTQFTYRFNGQTTQPLERTTAPGGKEPTSRCQTFPSMWTLGEDQPVIPTFWTQLTYRFNGRIAQPLERTTAPGGKEPTSRCQTSPSMWTLGEDQPVIPRITFIR